MAGGGLSLLQRKLLFSLRYVYAVQRCGQLLALCNNYITITFDIAPLHYQPNHFLYQLPTYCITITITP